MKLHRLGLIFLLFLGLSLLLTGCARFKVLVQEEFNRITRWHVTENLEKNRKDRLQICHPTKKTTTQSTKDRKRKSAKTKQKQKWSKTKDSKSKASTAATQNPKNLKPSGTEPDKELGTTKEKLSLSPI